MNATLRCPCGENNVAAAFEYDARPAGESPFPLTGAYQRRYDACSICGHHFSVHNLDLTGLYEGAYVQATYDSAEGMLAAFRRIISLPPEKSDNVARSARVEAFAHARLGGAWPPTLLDIGSGLGIFPNAMKRNGWKVTALDPDARATRHIESVVGVPVVTGDFFKVATDALGRFDVISLNKVLEHIEDPVAMLERAAPLLTAGGFVYVEVPDVAAAVEGPGREEFFIDHHHIFSPASLTRLVEGAGLTILRIERIREPSTKFTLFAFAEVRRARCTS